MFRGTAERGHLVLIGLLMLATLLLTQRSGVDDRAGPRTGSSVTRQPPRGGLAKLTCRHGQSVQFNVARASSP